MFEPLCRLAARLPFEVVLALVLLMALALYASGSGCRANFIGVDDWRPNEGPQLRFLECGAFECMFGGAAGGGKSMALIIDPLKWVENPNWRGVMFRRTYPELKRHLIPETWKYYRPAGAVWRASRKEWTFPSGAVLELGTMEHADDRFNFDSAAYHWVGFDELTTFLEVQYLYLISRMRTTDPTLPLRLRSATNPPPDEDGMWVLKRFAPWLYTPGENEDEYAGPYAVPEARLAFTRDEGETEERIVPVGTPGAMTRVFIPSKIEDNPHINESYADQLRMLDPLTYQQKRHGNWLVRPAPGLFFRRDMFTFVDAIPADVIARWRYWDRAATEPNPKNRDPDWTAGLRISVTRKGVYVVEDVARMRAGPDEVEAFIVATAEMDAQEFGSELHPAMAAVTQVLEQDPGQAGVVEIRALFRALAGFAIDKKRPTGDKITRAKPASAQCSVGNVALVRGPWNGVFITEAERFPMGKKDQIDAFSGGMSCAMGGGRRRATHGGRRKLASGMGGF